MNPDAPTPSADLPEPPAWLSARGVEIFRELVMILDGMGLASSGDVGMLAILAARLDDVEVTSALIEDAGSTYVSQVVRDDEGSIVMRHMKTHPGVRQRNEAARHAQSLLGQFGLSPAARSKVAAIAKPRGLNPFDELKS